MYPISMNAPTAISSQRTAPCAIRIGRGHDAAQRYRSVATMNAAKTAAPNRIAAKLQSGRLFTRQGYHAAPVNRIDYAPALSLR